MRHYYETNARLKHYYGPTEIHFVVGECSLGSILVAQSAKGVCAILLGDDPDGLVRDLQDRFPRAKLVGGDAAFEQLRRQGDQLRRSVAPGARPAFVAVRRLSPSTPTGLTSNSHP